MRDLPLSLQKRLAVGWKRCSRVYGSDATGWVLDGPCRPVGCVGRRKDFRTAACCFMGQCHRMFMAQQNEPEFSELGQFHLGERKRKKVSRAPSELAALLKKSQRIIIKSDAKSRRAFRRSFFLFLLLPRILLSQLICLATSYTIYFSHNRHVRLMHLRSVETHPKRIQRRERDQHDTAFHSLKEQACRSMS